MTEPVPNVMDTGEEIFEKSVQKTDDPKQKALAIILLVVTTILWGSTFIITKNTTEIVPPFFYMTIRFFIAGFAFLIFVSRFKGLTRYHIKISAIGGLYYFLSNATQTLGLNYTTASKAGFITGLNVIMVPIFLHIFYKHKVNKLLWFGVILATIGTALLTLVKNGPDQISWGDPLIFLCAVLYALYIIYLDNHLCEIDIIAFSSLQMLFVGIYSLLSSFLLDDWSYITSNIEAVIFTPSNIAILLYMGVIATSGSLLTQFYGQTKVSATKAAIIFALEPVFATLFGIWIGGETLTILTVIGAIFILVGIVISEIKIKRKIGQEKECKTDQETIEG